VTFAGQKHVGPGSGVSYSSKAGGDAREVGVSGETTQPSALGKGADSNRADRHANGLYCAEREARHNKKEKKCALLGRKKGGHLRKEEGNFKWKDLRLLGGAGLTPGQCQKKWECKSTTLEPNTQKQERGVWSRGELGCRWPEHATQRHIEGTVGNSRGTAGDTLRGIRSQGEKMSINFYLAGRYAR